MRILLLYNRPRMDVSILTATSLTFDTADEEYLTEYFEDLETALDWINEQTDSNVKSEEDVETLNDKLAAENENAFCYLHEIEII